MKWVISEYGSESMDAIAINSDTIKNVHLLYDCKNFYRFNEVESDKHIPGEPLHDNCGDIVIETNDGKMYRFWRGGTEWDEFQDSCQFSTIIYQRLLQALGSAKDGSIIVADIHDLTPAYSSRGVIVLFDYSEISIGKYDKKGLGLFYIPDCYGHELSGILISDELALQNEMLRGRITLKKEVE